LRRISQRLWHISGGFLNYEALDILDHLSCRVFMQHA
jgi:hypothetical protein